jgi:hypothetical protein
LKKKWKKERFYLNLALCLLMRQNKKMQSIENLTEGLTVQIKQKEKLIVILGDAD